MAMLEAALDPKVKVDLNMVDVEGVTPLLAAARAGKADLCTALLQHDADPNIPSKSGEYPTQALVRHVNGTALVMVRQSRNQPNATASY